MSDLLDIDGITFNAEIHQSAKSAKGKWIPKKGKVAEYLSHRRAAFAAKGVTLPEPEKAPIKPLSKGGVAPLDPLLAPLDGLTAAPEKPLSAKIPPVENGAPATPEQPAPEDVPEKPLGGDFSESPAATESAPVHLQRRANAMLVNGMIEGAVIGLLGKDSALDKNERAQVVAAWELYFEASGDVNLPPWLVVATAYIGALAPKMSKPTVKERIGLYWHRASTWWKNRKAKK